MAETSIDSIRVYYLSEQALTVEFGGLINETHLAKVQSLNKLLTANPFRGLLSTVPAYTTLSVFYDPVAVVGSEDLLGNDCFEKVSNHVKQLIGQIDTNDKEERNIITVPVCYEDDFGPDLEYLAKLHKLSTDEVIALHSGAVYKVGMIGFVPGFAYMMGLDSKLVTPRRKSPRTAVPAGSVGIAGEQTGIYSLETPGGWQIIGRTPLTLFDAGRSPTTLLKSGNRVQFKPISAEEFNQIQYSHADQHQ